MPDFNSQPSDVNPLYANSYAFDSAAQFVKARAQNKGAQAFAAQWVRAPASHVKKMPLAALLPTRKSIRPWFAFTDRSSKTIFAHEDFHIDAFLFLDLLRQVGRQQQGERPPREMENDISKNKVTAQFEMMLKSYDSIGHPHRRCVFMFSDEIRGQLSVFNTLFGKDAVKLVQRGLNSVLRDSRPHADTAWGIVQKAIEGVHNVHPQPHALPAEQNEMPVDASISISPEVASRINQPESNESRQQEMGPSDEAPGIIARHESTEEELKVMQDPALAQNLEEMEILKEHYNQQTVIIAKPKPVPVRKKITKIEDTSPRIVPPVKDERIVVQPKSMESVQRAALIDRYMKKVMDDVEPPFNPDSNPLLQLEYIEKLQEHWYCSKANVGKEWRTVLAAKDVIAEQSGDYYRMLSSKPPSVRALYGDLLQESVNIIRQQPQLDSLKFTIEAIMDLSPSIKTLPNQIQHIVNAMHRRANPLKGRRVTSRLARQMADIRDDVLPKILNNVLFWPADRGAMQCLGELRAAIRKLAPLIKTANETALKLWVAQDKGEVPVGLILSASELCRKIEGTVTDLKRLGEPPVARTGNAPAISSMAFENIADSLARRHEILQTLGLDPAAVARFEGDGSSRRALTASLDFWQRPYPSFLRQPKELPVTRTRLDNIRKLISFPPRAANSSATTAEANRVKQELIDHVVGRQYRNNRQMAGRVMGQIAGNPELQKIISKQNMLRQQWVETKNRLTALDVELKRWQQVRKALLDVSGAPQNENKALPQTGSELSESDISQSDISQSDIRPSEIKRKNDNLIETYSQPIMDTATYIDAVLAEIGQNSKSISALADRMASSAADVERFKKEHANTPESRYLERFEAQAKEAARLREALLEESDLLPLSRPDPGEMLRNIYAGPVSPLRQQALQADARNVERMKQEAADIRPNLHHAEWKQEVMLSSYQGWPAYNQHPAKLVRNISDLWHKVLDDMQRGAKLAERLIVSKNPKDNASPAEKAQIESTIKQTLSVNEERKQIILEKTRMLDTLFPSLSAEQRDAYDKMLKALQLVTDYTTLYGKNIIIERVELLSPWIEAADLLANAPPEDAWAAGLRVACDKYRKDAAEVGRSLYSMVEGNRVKSHIEHALSPNVTSRIHAQLNSRCKTWLALSPVPLTAPSAGRPEYLSPSAAYERLERVFTICAPFNPSSAKPTEQDITVLREAKPLLPSGIQPHVEAVINAATKAADARKLVAGLSADAKMEGSNELCKVDVGRARQLDYRMRMLFNAIAMETAAPDDIWWQTQWPKTLNNRLERECQSIDSSINLPGQELPNEFAINDPREQLLDAALRAHASVMLVHGEVDRQITKFVRHSVEYGFRASPPQAIKPSLSGENEIRRIMQNGRQQAVTDNNDILAASWQTLENLYMARIANQNACLDELPEQKLSRFIDARPLASAMQLGVKLETPSARREGIGTLAKQLARQIAEYEAVSRLSRPAVEIVASRPAVINPDESVKQFVLRAEGRELKRLMSIVEDRRHKIAQLNPEQYKEYTEQRNAVSNDYNLRKGYMVEDTQDYLVSLNQQLEPIYIDDIKIHDCLDYLEPRFSGTPAGNHIVGLIKALVRYINSTDKLAKTTQDPAKAVNIPKCQGYVDEDKMAIDKLMSPEPELPVADPLFEKSMLNSPLLMKPGASVKEPMVDVGPVPPAQKPAEFVLSADDVSAVKKLYDCVLAVAKSHLALPKDIFIVLHRDFPGMKLKANTKTILDESLQRREQAQEALLLSAPGLIIEANKRSECIGNLVGRLLAIETLLLTRNERTVLAPLDKPGLVRDERAISEATAKYKELLSTYSGISDVKADAPKLEEMPLKKLHADIAESMANLKDMWSIQTDMKKNMHLREMQWDIETRKKQDFPSLEKWTEEDRQKIDAIAFNIETELEKFNLMLSAAPPEAQPMYAELAKQFRGAMDVQQKYDMLAFWQQFFLDDSKIWGKRVLTQALGSLRGLFELTPDVLMNDNLNKAHNSMDKFDKEMKYQFNKGRDALPIHIPTKWLGPVLFDFRNNCQHKNAKYLQTIKQLEPATSDRIVMMPKQSEEGLVARQACLVEFRRRETLIARERLVIETVAGAPPQAAIGDVVRSEAALESETARLETVVASAAPEVQQRFSHLLSVLKDNYSMQLPKTTLAHADSHYTTTPGGSDRQQPVGGAAWNLLCLYAKQAKVEVDLERASEPDKAILTARALELSRQVIPAAKAAFAEDIALRTPPDLEPSAWPDSIRPYLKLVGNILALDRPEIQIMHDLADEYAPAEMSVKASKWPEVLKEKMQKLEALDKDCNELVQFCQDASVLKRIVERTHLKDQNDENKKMAIIAGLNQRLSMAEKALQKISDLTTGHIRLLVPLFEKDAVLKDAVNLSLYARQWKHQVLWPLRAELNAWLKMPIAEAELHSITKISKNDMQKDFQNWQLSLDDNRLMEELLSKTMAAGNSGALDSNTSMQKMAFLIKDVLESGNKRVREMSALGGADPAKINQIKMELAVIHELCFAASRFLDKVVVRYSTWERTTYRRYSNLALAALDELRKLSVLVPKYATDKKVKDELDSHSNAYKRRIEDMDDCFVQLNIAKPKPPAPEQKIQPPTQSRKQKLSKLLKAITPPDSQQAAPPGENGPKADRL